MITIFAKSSSNLPRKLSLIFKNVKIHENVIFYLNLDTYFVEKFPKRIFDLFDLYISRIKGFYNEESLRLKMEIKNYQG